MHQIAGTQRPRSVFGAREGGERDGRKPAAPWRGRAPAPVAAARSRRRPACRCRSPARAAVLLDGSQRLLRRARREHVAPRIPTSTRSISSRASAWSSTTSTLMPDRSERLKSDAMLLGARGWSRSPASPRPMNDGQRQPNGECRPVVLAGARDAHRAAVQLDEVLHDRQPEAQAADRARRRGVRLPEAVEHVRQEFGLDPDAGVGDGDLDVRRSRAPARPRPGRPSGELDGVGEQVPDDLLQPVRVPGDGAGQRVEQLAQRMPFASAAGRTVSTRPR